MMNNTCLADSFAIFLFCCPIYCEQTIAPPAASAENACITRILIESTSDTAEIAADPILLTIIVSAVPIIDSITVQNDRYQNTGDQFYLKTYAVVSLFLSSLFLLHNMNDFFIRLLHPLITDLCHMTDTVFRCLCTDTVTHTKRRIMNGRQRTKQGC